MKKFFNILFFTQGLPAIFFAVMYLFSLLSKNYKETGVRLTNQCYAMSSRINDNSRKEDIGLAWEVCNRAESYVPNDNYRSILINKKLMELKGRL